MAPKATTQKRKLASAEAPSTKKPKTSKAALTPSAGPKSKPKGPIPQTEPDELVLDASESSEDENVDDQTAALLKGFGSDSSASESGDYESNDDEDEASSKPLDLALLPDPTLSKKKASASSKGANAAKSSKSDKTPGSTVVYISRVPHGFHEAQMSAYFMQFGDLTHLRLARNRRTGRSRHFAFVRFADADVADIVARTMDNYLLFGHVLKCKLLSAEDLARLGGVEAVFKGSGRRFKKIPWNAIERNRLARADREGWKKRVQGEERRRSGKAAKLKELGYVFNAPEIKNVDEVPIKPNPTAVDGSEAKALENGATGRTANDAQENAVVPVDGAVQKLEKDTKSKSGSSVTEKPVKAVSNGRSKKKKIRT